MTRNLVVLTLVSLTQDAASELLYPLIPLLITVVLGAPPVVLGLIEGAAEAAAGFTKLLSGRLSDRYGRKPFVSLYLVSNQCQLAYAHGHAITLNSRNSTRLI